MALPVPDAFEQIIWFLENPFLALAVLFGASFVVTGSIVSTILLGVGAILAIVFTLIVVIVGGSQFAKSPDSSVEDWRDYIQCKAFESKYPTGKKPPIAEFIALYLRGEASLIDGVDMLDDLMMHRYAIFTMNICWEHVRFFLNTFVFQLTGHYRSIDKDDIAPVYNRGNDFYNWFLGPSMIYTTGLFHDVDESLEVAQDRKMKYICDQMQLQKGQQHLDIGCGWGTLARFASKHYGTESLGVSIAKEQVKYCKDQTEKEGLSKTVKFACMDYRDIPNKKFDAISCVEMAEHVGIRKFQTFLHQVKDLLVDDGKFYIQVAGLRRRWQYEDLIWGLFMGRYIFPGADASCPLAFLVSQLERAGFEVLEVKNRGCHYAHTIRKWYWNWIANEEKVEAKYGVYWVRLWKVFLSWSVMIAGQGSSTLWMATAIKNHHVDGVTIENGAEKSKINRSDILIRAPRSADPSQAGKPNDFTK